MIYSGVGIVTSVTFPVTSTKQHSSSAAEIIPQADALTPGLMMLVDSYCPSFLALLTTCTRHIDHKASMRA